MMSQARFKQIMSGMNSAAQKVYDAVPCEDPINSNHITTLLRNQGVGLAPNIVLGCLNTLKNAGLVSETREGWLREKVRKPYVRKGLEDLDREIKDAVAKSLTVPPEAMGPRTTPPTTPPVAPHPAMPAGPVIMTTKAPPCATHAPKDAAPAAPAAPVTTTPPQEETMQMSAPPKMELVDVIGNLAQEIAATADRHQREMRALANLVSDMAIEVQAQDERHAADTAKLHQLRTLLKDF